ETRLRKIEQQIRSLQAETVNLRFENQRLRAEAHNLLAINEHVSLVELHGYPTVRFSAVNLQVVNGTGSTENFNGTGNLLIGYNRLRKDNDRFSYEEECSLGSAPDESLILTREECEAANATWKLDHKNG